MNIVSFRNLTAFIFLKTKFSLFDYSVIPWLQYQHWRTPHGLMPLIYILFFHLWPQNFLLPLPHPSTCLLGLPISLLCPMFTKCLKHWWSQNYLCRKVHWILDLHYITLSYSVFRLEAYKANYQSKRGQRTPTRSIRVSCFLRLSFQNKTTTHFQSLHMS